jgi:hypothetical protein
MAAQLRSLVPPGPTPHGRHSPAVVSQYWSPGHSVLAAHAIGATQVA